MELIKKIITFFARFKKVVIYSEYFMGYEDERWTMKEMLPTKPKGEIDDL